MANIDEELLQLTKTTHEFGSLGCHAPEDSVQIKSESKNSYESIERQQADNEFLNKFFNI